MNNQIAFIILLLICYEAHASSSCEGNVITGDACDLSGITWSTAESYQNNKYDNVAENGVVVNSASLVKLTGLVNLDSNAVDPTRHINSFLDVERYKISGGGLSSSVTPNLVIIDRVKDNFNRLSTVQDEDGNYITKNYSYLDVAKLYKSGVNSLDSGFAVFKDVNLFQDKAYKTLKFAEITNGTLSLQNIQKDYGNTALRENSVLFNVDGSENQATLHFDKDTNINIFSTEQASKGSSTFNIQNVYNYSLLSRANQLKVNLDTCIASATTSVGLNGCQNDYNIGLQTALDETKLKPNETTINTTLAGQSHDLSTGDHYIVKALGSNAAIQMDGKLTGTSSSEHGMIYLDDSAQLSISKTGVVQSGNGTTISANKESRIENSGLIIAGHPTQTYNPTNNGASHNSTGSNLLVQSGSTFINNVSGVYIGETVTSADVGDNYVQSSQYTHSSIIVSTDDVDKKSSVINSGSMYFGGEINTTSPGDPNTTAEQRKENSSYYTRPINGISLGDNTSVINDGYMAIGITLGNLNDAQLDLGEREDSYFHGFLSNESSIISNRIKLGSINPESISKNTYVVNNGTIELGRNTKNVIGIHLSNEGNTLDTSINSKAIIDGLNNDAYQLNKNSSANISGYFNFKNNGENSGVKLNNALANIYNTNIIVENNTGSSDYSNYFAMAIDNSKINTDGNIIINGGDNSDSSKIKGFYIKNSDLIVSGDTNLIVNNIGVADAITLHGKSNIQNNNNKLNILMDDGDVSGNYNGIILDSSFTSNIDPNTLKSTFNVDNINISINATEGVGIRNNSNIDSLIIGKNSSITTYGSDGTGILMGSNKLLSTDNDPLTTNDPLSTRTIENYGSISSDNRAIKTYNSKEVDPNDTVLPDYNSIINNYGYIKGIVDSTGGEDNIINLYKDSIGDQFIVGGYKSGTINLNNTNSFSFNSLIAGNDNNILLSSDLNVNILNKSNIIINESDKKITGFDSINIDSDSILSFVHNANQFQVLTAKNKLTNVNVKDTGTLNFVNIKPKDDANSIVNYDSISGEGTINLIDSYITFGNSIVDFIGDVYIKNNSILRLTDYYANNSLNSYSPNSVNIENTGVLKIDNSGKNYVNTDLFNAGTLDLVSSNYDQTLLLTGSYQQNNAGKLLMNTSWNNDSTTKTDYLNIIGTATGNTQVFLKDNVIGNIDFNGMDRYSSSVVTVSDHNLGSNSFYGFAETSGIGIATLVQKNANNYAWYLPGNPMDGVLIPEVPAFVQLPNANLDLGYSLIQTLHQRVGEQSEAISNKNNDQLWIKVLGGKTDIDGKNRFNYSSSLWGLQFGYDLDIRQNQSTGGQRHSGIMFTYARDALKFYDEKTVSFNGNEGQYLMKNQLSGNADSNILALGAYRTYYDKNGKYLDVVGNVDYIKNKYTSSRAISDRNNSFGISLSAEVGSPYFLSKNSEKNSVWFIEPQAQLIYQYRNFENFTTLNDINVNQGDRNGLRGRLGFRLAYNTEGDVLRGNSLYFVANAIHDFSGKNKDVHIANMTLTDEVSKTFGEYGLGFQRYFNKNSSIYLDARYKMSLDSNDTSINGWNGNLGFKYQF